MQNIHQQNPTTHLDYIPLLKTRLLKRWFLTGRYDYAQRPYNKNIVEQAYSITAGWYATEFQKIEVEAKTYKHKS